jgi:hypothetical protein
MSEVADDAIHCQTIHNPKNQVANLLPLMAGKEVRTIDLFTHLSGLHNFFPAFATGD